tara:strand:- start:32093 stop:33055 length:963 start_codon:yes stop_codon:yes gene_type:complete
LSQITEFSNQDPNIIVGISDGDDAGVYKINNELSLIMTVDFFPPIVDDPFTFGEIAACNAVSDIYAMGGIPIIGVNIVNFPKDVDKKFLVEIIKGATSKAKEAGFSIIGGHSIVDQEPKFGMAITGLIKTGEQITINNGKPGDYLILTKPIGSGIITTASKEKNISESILKNTIKYMTQLNHDASHIMTSLKANACVDISGFGLTGHILEILNASNLSAIIDSSKIPTIKGVFDLAKKDLVPQGSKQNLEYSSQHIKWGKNIQHHEKLVYSDAQTSGGLLISIPKEKANMLINQLHSAGIKDSAVIGELTKNKNSKLIIN